jgi:hypothetical protein
MCGITKNYSIGAVIIRTVLLAKLVTSLTTTTTNQSHLTGKQTKVKLKKRKEEKLLKSKKTYCHGH